MRIRIRSKESEDRRRERWGGLNERYKEKRDDRKIERSERKDSVPPLRRDSYRNVGEQRSRSTVAFLAEMHVVHSRHRRQFDHQQHHQKHHPKRHRHSHVLRQLLPFCNQHRPQQPSHLRSKHHRYRLRSLQDHQVLINLLLHVPWEYPAIRRLGESVSSARILLEVVSDLRPRLDATHEHVPNLSQAGFTGVFLLEFLSHRRLRAACRDRSG